VILELILVLLLLLLLLLLLVGESLAGLETKIGAFTRLTTYLILSGIRGVAFVKRI